MIIHDARWETSDELARRISFRSTADRKDDSIKWCNDNHQDLIKWYREFSEWYPNFLKEKELTQREDAMLRAAENNRIFEIIKDGGEHFCTCGGRMRYIPGFNFCGCENYKNKAVYHNAYNYQLITEAPIIIDISKTHLSEFKKKYLIKNVMTSIIYKTLKGHNIPLLCEIEDSFFDTGRNAALQSKTEEKIVNEILTSKFDKVYYQQGIRVFDGKKWSTKIPDYIVVGDESIYVIDAKLAMRNINKDQLREYRDSVEIIAKKSNINQEVKSRFLIYNQEDFLDTDLTKNNCLNISMLRTL